MATTTAPIKIASKAPITATMSEWAAGLEFEQLSADGVYQAKRFLLDSIGCALGGYQQHDVAIALEVLNEIAGPGKATLIGSGKQVDPVSAALAMECGVPDPICHIIASHAAEGDLVRRTTEAYIVHHADFMAFLPFKTLGR